ncbi:MAG TPA: metallophosphoesterase [Puia sp.]|nr:metallophosphoesterase [Puia sp.]
MHGGATAIKILFIILGINFLLDWYVFNGLKTLTRDWRSARLRRWIKWGYLAVSLVVTILFVIGIPSYRTARGMTPYHEWMLSLFLVGFITKLFFCLVLLLGDLGRLFYGVGRKVVKRDAAGPLAPGRRRFISELAVLIGAVPFTGFLYGMLRGKYDYRVHRTTLYFEDLPQAFDGFTITQLSDIHSGSFDNTAAVKRGIDLARAQQSDLFVFTGDLVNNAAWEMEPYIEHFGQLKAPYGQYSILGNHDYGDYIQWDSEQAKADNLEKLKQHHATLGYRLLLDENVALEKGGQKISLIGVQNWGKGFIQIGDLDKAMEGVDKDAFKICLSHDPTHWEEKIRYHETPVHLTLSGHTHGAQFGVETDKLRWSPVQYRYLDWAGLANEGNRYLYVNRGFGFLAFSGRLGIWPEITVITLKKK